MANMTLKIDCINTTNGTVDVSSDKAEDLIYAHNYVYLGIRINGLDLTTCHKGDILVVDIEADGKTFNLVKNVSADKSSIKIISGKLKISSNGPASVISMFGNNVFNNVNLGDYAGKCRNGDLVQIRVVYDKSGNPVQCDLIENTMAQQRAKNTELTAKSL